MGLPMLAGNREGLPPFTGWVGRAMRAHRNMLENLVLFTALVLTAVVAGKTNQMTLLGAQLFQVGVEPLARQPSTPSSIHEMPSAVLPEALRAQPR